MGCKLLGDILHVRHNNGFIVSLPEKVKQLYWRFLPEKSHVSLMEKASDKSLLDDRDGEKKQVSYDKIVEGKNTKWSPIFFLSASWWRIRWRHNSSIVGVSDCIFSNPNRWAHPTFWLLSGILIHFCHVCTCLRCRKIEQWQVNYRWFKYFKRCEDLGSASKQIQISSVEITE